MTTSPVLIAYDGTELGARVIAQAGRQLTPGRDAIVAVVWQPVEVGFTPVGGQHFDADQATAVHEAAEQTAAHGAELATAAGLAARPLAVEGSPVCDGIIAAAQEAGADLIVVGARHHGMLASHLLGHIAPKVLSKTSVSVLVVHEDE